MGHLNLPTAEKEAKKCNKKQKKTEQGGLNWRSACPETGALPPSQKEM